MSHPPAFQLKDFDFVVPEKLVAQTPLANRHDSRLLYLNARSQTIEDKNFIDLPHILRQQFSSGPILIVANNSRVYPARLRIQRKTGARGEVFLVSRQPASDGAFECLLRPLKKLHVGEILFSEIDGSPLFEVRQLTPTPCVALVKNDLPLDELLATYGEMPLPPYIVRDPNRVGHQFTKLDANRYQTVYAKELGSQAAPTAGLHFTDTVLASLKQHHIDFAHVTLHVGLGTFQPVQHEDITKHVMHREYFSVDESVYKQIESTRAAGGKIIFVGTTSLRAIESFYRQSQEIPAHLLVGQFLSTDLFVWPRSSNEKFRPTVGDGIVTNFHQPQSTLAMLTAALLGYDFWRSAYKFAINAEYRFFSYGDASLILF